MKKIVGILIISLYINSCQKKPAISSKSEFYTDSIYSKYLSEYRKHNIYLPNGFNSKKKYPILYATDGGEIKENNFYKRTLDSLIDNRIINPMIMILSHSNNKVADSVDMGNGKKFYLTFRNYEYANNIASISEDSLLKNKFKNHMLYFNDELILKVENELNQNPNKKDRYFYGTSNGAGFGLNLLNKHPNKIGTYLCFSVFGGDVQSKTWKNNVYYPKLYLRYGNKEDISLKKDAEFLKLKYKELNLYADISDFEGGHDSNKWNEIFTEMISKIFATE